MITMRSAINTASSILCVTIKIALVGIFFFSHSSISSPRKASAESTSRAENGSSKHNNSGSTAIARARIPIAKRECPVSADNSGGAITPLVRRWNPLRTRNHGRNAEGQAGARVKYRGDTKQNDRIAHRENWFFGKSGTETKLAHNHFRAHRFSVRNHGGATASASGFKRDCCN